MKIQQSSVVTKSCLKDRCRISHPDKAAWPCVQTWLQLTLERIKEICSRDLEKLTPWLRIAFEALTSSRLVLLKATVAQVMKNMQWSVQLRQRNYHLNGQVRFVVLGDRDCEAG